MIRQPYDLDLAREHQRELRALHGAPGGFEAREWGTHSRPVMAADPRAFNPMRAATRSSSARSAGRRSPRRRLNRMARQVERLILGAAMELVAAVLERRIVRACVSERELSRAVAAGRP